MLISFNIRGSVHRNSRLKKSNETQQYADIYLLLNYSTYFGRPSRPSSGVHKIAVAASGTDHTIWVASYLLINYSTCFGRPSRPSSGVHKTVVAASGTDHTIWGASKQASKQACSPVSMICTRGCNYSFMYS